MLLEVPIQISSVANVFEEITIYEFVLNVEDVPLSRPKKVQVISTMLLVQL